MRFCIVWWLWLWLFPTNILSRRNGTTTRNRNVIACHLVRPEVSLEGGDDALHLLPVAPIQCWTNHPSHSYRVAYDIDLPESWRQSHQHMIDGGDALVYVSNAEINDSINRIMIHNDTLYSVSSYKAKRKQPQHRSLQQPTPPPLPTILRVLVVRVVDVDGQTPPESMDRIEGAIFGTGTESMPANVVTQLAALSHDQLTLVPASLDPRSSNDNNNNGVIEVTVGLAVNGSGFFRELLPALLNATEAVIGGSMADAADAYLFCLPDGAELVGQTGWKALTTHNEPYSFFQRSYCTGISAVIHELGHSVFGFSHSSTRGEEYGDISCYMGFIDNTLGYPLKAFNAHKHWLGGWFVNRTETLNTTALPWGGRDRRLVSFVDYRHEALLATDVALITVGDLFIQYDVSKGYNIHSLSPANVLITQSNDTTSRSVAVANLSIGESFTYHGVSDASNGIIIDVCDIGSANDSLDYSIISIYLNDGEQQSTCYRAENNSSSSPSSFISAVPSSIYSSVPSDVPSNIPSTPNRNVTSSSRPSDRPTRADNSPLPKTSGIDKYHSRSWLRGLMGLPIILHTILHPLALQYC